MFIKTLLDTGLIIGDKPISLKKDESLDTDQDVYYKKTKLEGDRIVIVSSEKSMSDDEKDEYEDYVKFDTLVIRSLDDFEDLLTSCLGFPSKPELNDKLCTVSYKLLNCYSIFWYAIISLVIAMISIIIFLYRTTSKNKKYIQ